MATEIGRRRFLRAAAGAGTVMSLGGVGELLSRAAYVPHEAAVPEVKQRKLIVVLFGGGTRSSESIDDPEHRCIPRLWSEMVPHGTLFRNMRVEHRVVHPNCTGSILTGHWEWNDNDWSRPLAHPTVFEIYRKARCAPDTAAWAFVYASILKNVGESLAPDHGVEFAANVVEPTTIPRSTAEEMTRHMREAAASGSLQAELDATQWCAQLARKTSRISREGLRSGPARVFVDSEYEAWKSITGTTSHDVFLTDRAIACMRRYAPGVMAVAYGEIDCAHYGSWPRYLEAIRRTDGLTWRLWQATQQIDAYRDRTLMLILPDHGRELDGQDRWGFIHHSDFYTNQGADEGCRRVWMLALGPDVKAGLEIDKP
ncbi:MAG: hypothetical protein JSU86_05115, partial [Phycisphaerales bacterium]